MQDSREEAQQPTPIEDYFHNVEALEGNDGVSSYKGHLIRHENLGHKQIQNMLVYSVMEACELLEAGFEYVTDMDGGKIFRKRKRQIPTSPY